MVTDDNMVEAQEFKQLKMKQMSELAIGNINNMIEKDPAMTVFEVMEYIKITNLYGAKIISRGAFKGDVHPNVRTVLEDLHTATMELKQSLEEINPELKDDFVWPEEDKGLNVEAQ